MERVLRLPMIAMRAQRKGVLPDEKEESMEDAFLAKAAKMKRRPQPVAGDLSAA